MTSGKQKPDGFAAKSVSYSSLEISESAPKFARVRRAGGGQLPSLSRAIPKAQSANEIISPEDQRRNSMAYSTVSESLFGDCPLFGPSNPRIIFMTTSNPSLFQPMICCGQRICGEPQTKVYPIGEGRRRQGVLIRHQIPKTSGKREPDGLTKKRKGQFRFLCSEAPPGRKRWTLRLLAEKVVELGWVERVSVMTVQRTLKKTNCSLIERSIGGSRPGAAPHS